MEVEQKDYDEAQRVMTEDEKKISLKIKKEKIIEEQE